MSGSEETPTVKPWKRLAPGKMRILQTLQDGGPTTYTAIKTKARLQDPSLIKYLKEMILDRLVEKDADTRAYRITRGGEAEIYAARASELLVERAYEVTDDKMIERVLESPRFRDIVLELVRRAPDPKQSQS
jgi:predicted transcriptional regulator